MPPKLKLAPVNDDLKRKNFNDDVNKCNDPKLYSNDGNIDRLQLNQWVLPNRKDFMKFIKTSFNKATRDNKRTPLKLWKETENRFIDISPFKHQKFVSDYLSDNSPYRGLLLYHGLGSGKSGASVMIGEGFKDRHVVILLPASLRDNYITEINTFAELAYKKNYHWCKIRFEEGTSDLESEYLSKFTEKGIDKVLLNKIKKETSVGKRTIRSIWMIDYTKDTPNYDTMNEKQKQEIDEQIKILLDHKYSILHYNAGQYTITKILERLMPNYKVIYTELFGEKPASQLTNKDRDLLLNYIYNPENNVENPFNNKVLIVDEIHNLTSKMVGGGFNGSRLYELIIRATDLKIVFLSGTPVINNPFELALMFNMLRGFIYQFKIPLERKAGNFNIDELNDILYKIETIDRINVDISSKHIEITRLPKNFINTYKLKEKTGVKYSNKNAITEKEFLNDIFIKLGEKGYQQSGDVEKTVFTVFPGILKNSGLSGSMRGSDKYIEQAEKQFSDTYVDKTSLKVSNSIEFKNRILGLVSFYNEISGIDKETGANLFPDKIYADKDEVTVEMSNFQFVEYAAKRRIERKMEDASKRQFGREDSIQTATQKMPSLFKVFSRQKGLFVFPPSIERPRPPQNRKFIKKNITKNVYYNLSDEVMDGLIKDLQDILRLHTGNDRIKRYRTFLEKYSINSDEYKFIEKLISEIMSNYSNIEDYTEWLSTHSFTEDEFEIPDFVEEEEENYKNEYMNAINKLTSDHLSLDGNNINLRTLSPKYALMLENIQKSPGNVFCYSQFRSVEGIEIFSKALLNNGYTRLVATSSGEKPENYDIITEGDMVRYEYADNDWKSYRVESVDSEGVTLEGLDDMVVSADKVHKCRFALWTGTESVEERRAIQNTYNNSLNMYGQKCIILLTTQSGSEGISLMNVRQVHVMEPYWNNVRISQVIGRARRIKSHIYLPEKHRNVKIFQYIIKFTDRQLEGAWVEDMSDSDLDQMRDGKESGFTSDPEDDPDSLDGFRKYAETLSREVRNDDKGITSDQVLDTIAKNKEEILSAFLWCIKEASVDCEFNYVDNLSSDSSLESLKCYNNIYNESEYSFDVITNDSTVSKKSEKHEEVVKTRYLNVYSMVNKQKLKIMIALPSEFDHLTGLKDILDNLPNNYDKIYNYYTYNNLETSGSQDRNVLVSIGRIVKNKTGISFQFKAEFTDKASVYANIEECIKTLGPMPKTTVDLIKWEKSVKECITAKKSEDWICPGCNTKFTNDTIECKKCNITLEDTQSLKRDMGASRGSSQETMSTVSSKKSKTSTKRVRF